MTEAGGNDDGREGHDIIVKSGAKDVTSDSPENPMYPNCLCGCYITEPTLY